MQNRAEFFPEDERNNPKKSADSGRYQLRIHVEKHWKSDTLKTKRAIDPFDALIVFFPISVIGDSSRFLSAGIFGHIPPVGINTFLFHELPGRANL